MGVNGNVTRLLGNFHHYFDITLKLLDDEILDEPLLVYCL
jgi:hypothetical protein